MVVTHKHTVNLLALSKSQPTAPPSQTLTNVSRRPGRPRDNISHEVNKEQSAVQNFWNSVKPLHSTFGKSQTGREPARAEIPRRSLRLEWLQDNADLIAAGQEPFYQFVLFGEQEYDLENQPPDGYSTVVN